jgi:hypothetical protein
MLAMPFASNRLLTIEGTEATEKKNQDGFLESAVLSVSFVANYFGSFLCALRVLCGEWFLGRSSILALPSAFNRLLTTEGTEATEKKTPKRISGNAVLSESFVANYFWFVPLCSLCPLW